MTQFFAMGGYAAFVWPSFIITALVLIVMAFISWRAMKKNEAELKTLQGVVRAKARPTSPVDGSSQEHA